MKINNLYFYALNKLKIIGIAFIASTFVAIASVASYQTTFQEKNSLSTTISTSKRSLENLNSGVINAENSAKIWNNGLNLKYNQRQGIQIENAKKRLEIIKGTFNITELKVSLNTPQKVEGISQLKFQDVMYSKLALDFNAYTDADAVKFIDAVTRQLPGILLIQDFKIYAPTNIRSSLNQALSKGSIKDLQDTVKVTITINWFDFIDKFSDQTSRSVPTDVVNVMKSTQNMPTMPTSQANTQK